MTVPFPPAGPDWIEMRPGIHRRTLAVGERLMQMLVHFAPGSQLPVHQHHHEQVSHILTGRLRFQLAGGLTREVGAGETLLLPGHAPHGAEALGETLVLETFSPPREDLLAPR